MEERPDSDWEPLKKTQAQEGGRTRKSGTREAEPNQALRPGATARASVVPLRADGVSRVWRDGDVASQMEVKAGDGVRWGPGLEAGRQRTEGRPGRQAGHWTQGKGSHPGAVTSGGAGRPSISEATDLKFHLGARSQGRKHRPPLEILPCPRPIPPCACVSASALLTLSRKIKKEAVLSCEWPKWVMSRKGRGGGPDAGGLCLALTELPSS